MINKKIVFFLMLTMSSLLLSCGDHDNFKSSYREFCNSYYKATTFCDSDEIQLEALKNIDPEEVNDELENMKTSLVTLKKNIKTDQERNAYKARKKDYEDLLYLVNNYNKYDDLDEEEKLAVEDILFKLCISRPDSDMEK